MEKDDKWEINLHGDPQMSEEIESWNQIFNIDNRYKNRIRTRYKNNWYGQIIKIYKRNKSNGNFEFEVFKNEVYDGLRPINVQESSIIERAYYDYFFSDINCEYNLSQTVQV